MFNLIDTPAVTALSIDEQAKLLLDAQDVPVYTVTDDDGVEHLAFGSTPAAEAALDHLTRAFMPAIRKAAGRARRLDPEEAFAIATETFIVAVRDYDASSGLPFSAGIATILARSISDAQRTAGAIVVSESVAAIYRRLMHKYDTDVVAAYRECQTTANGLDANTFLAAHYALHTESLDVLDSPDLPGSRDVLVAHRDAIDDFVTANLVDWLLTQTTERQEAVLRHHFGFRDDATETSLLAADLRPGDVLTDTQVGAALGLPRSTVARDRVAGLAAAKEAYAAEVSDAVESE